MKNRTLAGIIGVFFIVTIVMISIAKNKDQDTNEKKFKHAINPEKCAACGTCAEECPEEAISAGKIDGKDVYIIDPQKCNACGTCAEVCPEEAIYPDSSDLFIDIKDESEKTEEKVEKKEPEKKKVKKVNKYIVK